MSYWEENVIFSNSSLASWGFSMSSPPHQPYVSKMEDPPGTVSYIGFMGRPE